ncbi:MAG: hypothetical protein II998_08565 [Clostridia bacterium]|nr:hypothetical protein [Clostridia bacterium]
MFTKFLTPLEAREISSRFPKGEVNIAFFGGYDGAERTVASFGEVFSETEYPLCCLEIRVKGKHSLSHRDFLGSAISLGLKRELLGDIIVCEEGALLFCLDEIADYIADNLTKIANTGVSVRHYEGEAVKLSRNYVRTSSTVSSLRLDAVVSAATSKSRATSAEMIQRGLVSHNYKEAISVSMNVKDGDIITVRGIGKYLINTDEKLTRKGRIHIDINKYA